MIVHDLLSTPRRHQHGIVRSGSISSPKIFTPTQSSLHNKTYHYPYPSIENGLNPSSSRSYSLPENLAYSSHPSALSFDENPQSVFGTELADFQTIGLAEPFFTANPFANTSTPLITIEAIGLPSPQHTLLGKNTDNLGVLEKCSSSKFRDPYSHDPDTVMAVVQTESIDPDQRKITSNGTQQHILSPPGLLSTSEQSDIHSQYRHPRRRRIVSANPLPHLTHTWSAQQQQHQKCSPLSSLGKDSSRTSKHLPTPTDTPTQDTFSATRSLSKQNSLDSDGGVEAEMAIRRVLYEQNSSNEDDVPGFTHSSRHSASSHGLTPTTPRTVNGDDSTDEKSRLVGKVCNADGTVACNTSNHNSLNLNNWLSDYQHPGDGSDTSYRPTIPKFDRTMSDAYQDELYNPFTTQLPPVSAPSAPSAPANTMMLSPYHNSVREMLQAAEAARHNTANAAAPSVSPFRANSPLVVTSDSLATSNGADIGSLSATQPGPEVQPQIASEPEPKTISPKEAMLDYNELPNSKYSLFADNKSGGADYRQHVQEQLQSAPPLREHVYDMAVDTTRPPPWEMKRQTSHIPFNSTPPDAVLGLTPATASTSTKPMPAYTSQHQRNGRLAAGNAEANPEFPAHLTSMESSISDIAPDSSQNSVPELKKPVASSLADRGTYTCTYHGCTLRFDTPQKLQRHKREGHRSQQQHFRTSVSPGGNSNSSDNNMNNNNNNNHNNTNNGAHDTPLNSQAGPHRCNRINPTTGKPCETVFSRPYDLTRHEDTIHNARKQKVRCALCVEEKTFSRNDALTRHMRVVHPTVDFPGKYRKRGGGSVGGGD